MNSYVIKTELYKIFSKKYLWIVAAFFTVLFALISLQTGNSIDVRYPLAQFEDAVAQVAKEENLTQKVEALDQKEQNSQEGLGAVSEDMKALLPESVVSYTEQFRGEIEHGVSVADLLNNLAIAHALHYGERLDDRQAEMTKLRDALTLLQSKGEIDSFAYRAAEREYQLYASAPEIRPDLTNWGDFVDLNATFLPMFIVFMVILGLCGIYSDEYSNKTQSAMLTSKNGRAGVFGSKLIAGFTYTAAVTAFFQLVGFGFYSFVFGLPDKNTPLASLAQFYMSPYHLSAQAYYLFQIFGSFLGAFVLAAVVLCFSSLAKNALFPFLLSGGIFAAGFILKKLITLGAGESTLLTFPAELSLFLTMSWQELVSHYRVTNLFGNPVSTVWVNLCVSVFVGLAALLLCCRFYTKKQVKN